MYQAPMWEHAHRCGERDVLGKRMAYEGQPKLRSAALHHELACTCAQGPQVVWARALLTKNNYIRSCSKVAGWHAGRLCKQVQLALQGEHVMGDHA